MEQAIRVDNLTYRYPKQEDSRETEVFSELDLTIEQGSFVVVLGHNGCGKSTLAKHFNAILLPSGGKVWVYGKDTTVESELIAIRRAVGMVFQNPDNQIVSNVVEEDVAFAPENLGVEPEEIRRRVDEALRMVGMYEFREHAPHLLSGGQKQRVAIAGVIAMLPKCIVLDEPTAMLDPQGRREVLETIHRLNRDRSFPISGIVVGDQQYAIYGNSVPSGYYPALSSSGVYMGQVCTEHTEESLPPVEPVDPDNPDVPVDPNNPDQPVDPNNPDQPTDPNNPDQPLVPVDPGNGDGEQTDPPYHGWEDPANGGEVPDD